MVKQDADIKDRKGTQPAKYYAGKMKKSTKTARARHFEKGAKMSDDNPKAYKDAPGDKTAKTKPSKHTIKFKKMYGEVKTIKENKKGLQNKSEKSGISYSILKKVYDRGMAAWRTGHRPGTTPEQWGMARVNSFITKGKGTWGKADADLAKKVRGESVMKESGHTDVASMKNKVQIAMSALQKMNQELGKISDEDDLPTWWTNKVATAVSRLDDMSDYLDTQVESVSLEEDMKSKNAAKAIHDYIKKDKNHALGKLFRRQHDALEFFADQLRDKGLENMHPSEGKKHLLDVDRDGDVRNHALTMLAKHVGKTKVQKKFGKFKQFQFHFREMREQKMDCPPATQDIKLNTKNRDATTKNHNYGPLNVDEPGDYWEKVAKHWKTSVEAAKKSKCANCVAFDISPRMKECLPGSTSDGDGELGYCYMHHFKCHSARSCHTWAKGGPIKTDEKSYEWQEKSLGEEIPANATGTNVAGTGSDSSTVPVNKVRSILRRKFDTKTFFKKKKDINESHDTFAGNAVFHVDNDTFANCREGKKKFARWEKYIDLKSTVGQQIRDYAYKYPKKSIIIRNEDGAMIYLKGTHMREKKDWEKGFHMTSQDYEEAFAEMFPPTEVKRTDSISANHHYLKKKKKKKK